MADLSISIIIPAVNEAAAIERAVRGALAAGAGEVIVADGGSRDETHELAASAGARVVESKRGRAVQQNTGAAAASGDVLLFQHADNWFEDDIAAQIHSALTNDKIQGGAFRQRIDDPRFRFRLLEWGNAWRVRWQGLPYGDQAIFLRRERFEQLGRFPEVPLMEDYLLMKAFRRQCRPMLLDGPHFVSPRRWIENGVLRQTVRNWTLVTRHRLGASPADLAKAYRPHDQTAPTALADGNPQKTA